MKVYFLGTGTSQGIPVIGSHHSVCLSDNPKDKRLRVAIWISWDDFSYVIDCGPDFRQQMLVSKCQKVDGILFTHEHSDHTAGIDDIRPFNYKQGVMPIFAHKRVIENLNKRFDYIFQTENKYPGAPSVSINEVINNQPFLIGNKTVIPIDGMHGNLQVFGYRIDDFAYLTDIKTVENSEIEKLKGLKVLVINALREEPHHSHFNLEEALNLAKHIESKMEKLWYVLF